MSPVFERMFYGDFKEGNAKVVELPKDSYKVTKLLIDFLYHGTFELSCLSDLIPLMEVADRYQIKKKSLQKLCGKCVSSKLDSTNYSILLPKYASLMTEEDCKKTADKVVDYTKSDLMNNFHRTKRLPEEIVLPLLQCSKIHCSESELFDFVIGWYKYQRKKLEKSLKRIPKIF